MSRQKSSKTKERDFPSSDLKHNDNSKPKAKARDAETPLEQALRHAAAENYQKAADVLRSSDHSSPVRNALGVCLMRLGRAQEATSVYRDFVLTPGSTWMRPELPTIYKTNFATSLLLGGHPSGCVSMLADIKEQSHPAVVQLKEGVRRWEKGLSRWNWINWQFFGIEPDNSCVNLDFAPGHFEASTAPDDNPHLDNPLPTRPRAE